MTSLFTSLTHAQVAAGQQVLSPGCIDPISWDQSEDEDDLDVSSQASIGNTPPAIPQELITPPAPILLSSAPYRSNNAYRRDAIEVQDIIYTSAIPDWPKSSSTGIAYVVNTETLHDADREKPWDTFQYTARRCIPPETTTSAFFNSLPVKLFKYQCTGVKACEFLDNELSSYYHTEVDEAYWQLREKHENRLTEPNNIHRDAISWGWAIQNDYKLNKACKKSATKQLPTCKPRLQRSSEQALGGAYQWFIRCYHYEHSNNHQSAFVNESFHPYLESLKQVLENPDQVMGKSEETCCCIDRTLRQRKHCDFTHILGGQGRIKKISCDVIWRIFIPEGNLIPYLIIASFGTHTHPPPPPSRIPPNILRQLSATLDNTRGNTQGLNAWLQSTPIQQLLQEQNKGSLAGIHPSLANTSRLRYLLRKHQAIHVPMGSSRLGCFYEWYMNHRRDPNRYLQSYYNDGINFLVIMFFREQVEILRKPQFVTFQVGMNFKHIYGNNEYEVIFSTYDSQARMTIPIIRTIMSAQSSEAYKFMFSSVFEYLATAYDINIRWRHIHNEGIYGVTIDQDWGSLKGLSLYLSEKVSQDLTWIEHAVRCIRLCKLHFQRGVEQTCHQLQDYSTGPDSMYGQMLSLYGAQTKSIYFQICALLRQEYPALDGWVKNKMHPVVAAGLCNDCSQISPHDWTAFQSTTNPVEVLHEASYRASGRQVTLSRVVECNQAFDRQKIDQYLQVISFRLQPTYENTTVGGRFERQNQRKRHRATQRNTQSQRSRSSTPSQGDLSSPYRPSSPTGAQRVRGVSSSGVLRRSSSQLSIRSRSTTNSQPRQANSIRSQELQLQLQIIQEQRRLIQDQKELAELEIRKLELEKDR